MKELVIEIDGLTPGHPVTVALKADLTISADLKREVTVTAAHFGYYAVLAEKAYARMKRTKLAFEIWSSGVEAGIYDRIKADTGKAPKTVKDVTRELMKIPKYQMYRLRIEEYEEHANILRAIAKAFEHKKDLVQTMNANRRKELS
jgi:hypothetical protein